jgi:hypothetical protein
VTFPWRSYPREHLVLALVALTGLAVMQEPSTQDQTRLALTQSILERGTLDIDPYRDTTDKAFYDGHYYTDKAPGISFFAIPHVAAVRAVDRVVGNPTERAWDGGWRRYILRVLINGPFLLGFAFVAGRAGEGLVRGTGAATAAIAGVGTLAAPLSLILFSHVAAALLGLGAFLLAWRRTYFLAGLCAGGAVLVEYPAGFIAILVALYVAARGLRPLLRYAAGGVPAAIVLGAYNWLAFDSPFRLSYRYTDSVFTEALGTGLFGIGLPTREDVRAVLIAGSGFGFGQGLLVTSPALVAAAVGLVLLWRRGLRAEALVCLAVGAFFLLSTAGNEYPFGGYSPGPRYFAPALGFVLLGLPEAFRRWPRLTVALGAFTIGVATLNALAWAENNGLTLRHELPRTIWSAAGLPKEAGVGIVFACAAALAWAALAPLLRGAVVHRHPLDGPELGRGRAEEHPA